jgi:hypothetical protein
MEGSVMKKFACRYAIVQFVPYVETGEFANVGVVLICPLTGFFGFQLQTKRFARVTGFFKALERSQYIDAVKHMQHELERIQKFLATGDFENHPEALRSLFTTLIHPREAIMRYGEARAVLTDDPQEKLNELFEHYVDHSFATSEYMETKMTKRLQSLLSELPLVNPFRPARLGDDTVHANFDLVQHQMHKAAKVIKPFNLDQADPNGIYAHGDVWVPRIRRLQEGGHLPKDTMFTVFLASKDDPKRRAAGMEIVEGLKQRHIQVVEHHDENLIKKFAIS